MIAESDHIKLLEYDISVFVSMNENTHHNHYTDHLSVDAQNNFFRHLSLSVFTWDGAVRAWY